MKQITNVSPSKSLLISNKKIRNMLVLPSTWRMVSTHFYWWVAKIYISYIDPQYFNISDLSRYTLPSFDLFLVTEYSLYWGFYSILTLTMLYPYQELYFKSFKYLVLKLKKIKEITDCPKRPLHKQYVVFGRGWLQDCPRLNMKKV